MNYIKHLNNIITDMNYDCSDKIRSTNTHILYMLNRTQSMFKWSGLPDTIPEYILELYLQTNGNVCFYKPGEDLFIFCGGLGGEPDVYYRPTIYTISNPALKISKSLKINTDCVVMPNDSLYLGLLPLFKKYAYLLTENELSLKIAIINSRIIDLITAPDDRTFESAKKFLSDIVEGKLGVISDNAFLDGIKTQPYGNTSNTNTLTNLIECEQYLRATWFNELGLNANYNMKRESLNSSESKLNDDVLLPLVDNMLSCRKEYADKVNQMFNTNISVDFSSSWKDNIEELEITHKELEDGLINEENKENETIE